MNDTKRQDTNSMVELFCVSANKLTSLIGELAEKIQNNTGTPEGEAYERFAQGLFTPETKAWGNVHVLIESAQKDPKISINPEVMEFLEIMKTLSGNAWGHWKLSRVLQPLVDQLNSAKARFAATQKNEAPRAWVLTEWENRTDKRQSKASFARQYAALVKIKFRDTDKGKDLTVTPETIARDWLPKVKK